MGGVAKAIVLPMIFLVSTAMADVAEWIINPDTGHWYGLTEEVWHGIDDGPDCNENIGSWWDAQAFAESLGGYLAVINSESENTWIVQTFIERMPYAEVFWFGMTDSGSEGTWYWINGEPVEFTGWGINQPDDMNQYGEDCASMLGPPYTGYWNDLGCWADSYTMSALIEVEDSPVLVTVANWGLVKSNY